MVRRTVLALGLLCPLVVVGAQVVAPRSAALVGIALSGVSVVAAAVAMVLSARRGDPTLRTARRWLAAALVAGAVGLGTAAAYTARHGGVPVLSAVNLAPLLWVPCAMVGLLAIPTRAHRDGRLRAVLDASIVSSALILTFWLLFLRPLYASSDLTAPEKVVVLAYPVLDVVLAVTAFCVAAQTRAGLRRFLHLVTLGFLLIAVADGMRTVHVATAHQGFDWASVLQQLGVGAFLWAALTPTLSERADDSVTITVADAVLPHVPVAVGFGVWTWHLSTHDRLDADVLVVTVLLAGLLVRQLMYARSAALVSHRLSVEATHDGLTGLANRRACLDGLASWLAEAPPGEVAVVLFDLDGFKDVNDDFGHAAGDQALTDFATALREVAGDDGVQGRLGGDEFALLTTGPSAGARAAAAASQLVRGRVTRIGAVTLKIGASAGVAESRAGDTTSTLLRRADLALYEAKRGRRSAVVVFEDGVAERAERRHQLAQALPDAARRGELSLVYQPLRRVADDGTAGVEALLRWQHPVFGAVSPAEFIPLAEETGVIEQVGRWVLDAAVRDVREWSRRGLAPPQVFVNVSAAQLTDAFPGEVQAALSRTGVDSDALVLEVTESAMPDAAARACLAELRAAGLTIAMDDFGSGFSSLAQLAVLPVDILKFDREFVRGLHTRNGRRIVDGMVALAHSLGLVTVAEGVETGADDALVRQAGFTMVQGFHYARPVAAADVATTLEAAGPVRADAAAPSAVSAVPEVREVPVVPAPRACAVPEVPEVPAPRGSAVPTGPVRGQRPAGGSIAAAAAPADATDVAPATSPA